jgi:hypothetical protein
MPRSRSLLAVLAVAVAASVIVPAAAQELDIDDLQRSPSDFSYYQLGRHVPERSGWKDYIGGRQVIHPTMGLPLEINPKQNEHMYCNTQVWGFKDNLTTGGKSNNVINYSFPWTSTFCEKRDFPGVTAQATRNCRPDRAGQLRQSHQGSDCRPPKPLAGHYWMIAVEDGVIVKAGRNLVEMVGDSGIKWKYRHGDKPPAGVRPGVRVMRGARLTTITDLKSTPIHLHLESERPASVDRDNMPSLILAYERALGVPETTMLPNGELTFDRRFEIPEESVAAPCAASERLPALGTEQQVTFKELWCHSGSIVGLTVEGGTRKAFYYKPREAVREAATKEPLLFDGAANGSSYEGTSVWFSSRCGNRRFPVKGVESEINGVRILSLLGKRPSFSRACDDPDFIDETVQLSFMRAWTDPVPVDTAGDGAPPPVAEPPPPVTTPPVDDLLAGVEIKGPCATAVASTAIAFPPGAHFESLWCHNSSIVGLIQSGAERQIRYYRPRQDMLAAALRDPVLFKGKLEGTRWSGDSIWYSIKCGDRRFGVTGSQDATGAVPVISLFGERPSFARGCGAPRLLPETMTFALLLAIGPVPPAPEVSGIAEEPLDTPNKPLPVWSCEGAERHAVLAPAEQTVLTSLWCYDRSILGLVENGDKRRVVYYRPRPAIRNEAARQPVLFTGTQTKGDYSGKSRWLNKACGDPAFDVTGREMTVGGVPTLVLSGTRADLSGECDAAERIEQRIVATFLKTQTITLQAEERPPPDAPHDEPAHGPGSPSDPGPVPEPQPGPVVENPATEQNFNLVAPTSLSGLAKLRLWSTKYHVEPGEHTTAGDAVPLRSMASSDFGAQLKPRTFCNAAVEGTVRINFSADANRSFNYAGVRSGNQANCGTWFRASIAGPASRVRWAELPADAPFGLGNVSSLRLVPYRSIAADQPNTRLKRGTVIFIPALRGQKFSLHGGASVAHDGYLYVADVGGAIKGAHIDFFSGLDVANPFPALIRSSPSGTFDAYLIDDVGIKAELDILHRRSGGRLIVSEQ